MLGGGGGCCVIDANMKNQGLTQFILQLQLASRTSSLIVNFYAHKLFGKEGREGVDMLLFPRLHKIGNLFIPGGQNAVCPEFILTGAFL